MRAVSRDDFLCLFALYAFAARHHKQHDRASRPLKLFASSRTSSDDLLDQWSERAEASGPEVVGSVLSPRARAVTDDDANYDHASALLHAFLKALDHT